MRTQSDLWYKTSGVPEVYQLIQEHLPKYLNLIKHTVFLQIYNASENKSKKLHALF